MNALATPNELTSDFLKIDEFRLEKECLAHSELYYKHAVLAGKAQKTRDAAKINLDLVAAEVDALVRNSPEKYGITKVTEAAIRAAVLKHKNYQAAQEELNQTQYRFSIRSAAVTAMEHRKRMLTLTVGLHQSNYFSDPKVTAGRAAREKMEEASQIKAAAKTQIRREDTEQDD